MKFGVDIICFLGQNWKRGIDFHIECAEVAEEAGWDGFFIWDHIWGFWEGPLITLDPWIVLAAAAVKTESIRLGPMVTPLARRRPWKMARETVSLDHLSGGRVTLGIGLGGTTEEFGYFGEEPNSKIRAEKLDESLEILVGLWSGTPFSFNGKYYHLKEVTFLPKPIQKPRIPIWVAGYWPKKAPFKRAARFEGVFPGTKWGVKFTPERLKEILITIRNQRQHLQNFEVVVGGETTGTDPSKDTEIVQPWIDAGATWWMENITDWIGSEKELLQRIRQGPPEV